LQFRNKAKIKRTLAIYSNRAYDKTQGLYKNFCKQDKAAQLCGWLAEYILLASLTKSNYQF